MKHIALPLLLGMTLGLSACSTPKAQGLPPQAMTLPKSEQQAELFWRTQSFAFLLYQEPQASQTQPNPPLQILALTLSGQLLFELSFDGQTLHTVQKHPKLKALPTDYLMRDIWWAAMPLSDVESAISSLNLAVSDAGNVRTIYPKDTPSTAKLTATKEADGTLSIQNHDVPYRIVISNTQEFVISD